MGPVRKGFYWKLAAGNIRKNRKIYYPYLLTAVLTVRAHEAASHAGHGWERFTDEVVKAIALRKQGVVYMLWGSYAQRKASVVDPQRNCILKAVHPSPLSAYRGFFGCRHFSRANEYLQSIGREPIRW